MKVALYARISTTEGRQHLSNQLKQLRDYAKRMKHKISKEYTDQASGADPKRPGLDALLDGASRREFDEVIVYDLSRITRGGPASAFQILARLEASGITFVSFKEEHFRSGGIAGPLLIAIAAYIAQQEREQLRHRIKSGIARARAQGTRFGRPRRVVDWGKAQKLQKQGKSLRQIAKQLNTSAATVLRRLAAK